MRPYSNKETVPEYLINQDWLNDLSLLMAKYSVLKLYPDMAAMTVIELYSVYQWLRNLGM